MKRVLITGANGFIGRNLCVGLRRDGFETLEFSRNQPLAELPELVDQADVIFHLAGVNRPKDEQEFTEGNVDLTRRVCEFLTVCGRGTPLVFTSSTQAALGNAYGRSKKEAEDAVLDYHHTSGAPVYIYRLPNVFGKWSRPDYNTVVATLCYNINRGLPVNINDRAKVVRLAYIDDIVRMFLRIASRQTHDPATTHYEYQPIYDISLGQLHDLIESFRDSRAKLLVPDLSSPLTRHLYSTYASFCEADKLAISVELKEDERGSLFELIKSSQAGQIFVSRTHPGITRGNHYHDSKIEKFCVIQGQGIVRLRHLLKDEITEYPMDGRAIQVVDIPAGYTHSIENVGTTDMITLFWANEIFDPQNPDTHLAKAKKEEGGTSTQRVRPTDTWQSSTRVIKQG